MLPCSKRYEKSSSGGGGGGGGGGDVGGVTSDGGVRQWIRVPMRMPVLFLRLLCVPVYELDTTWWGSGNFVDSWQEAGNNKRASLLQSFASAEIPVHINRLRPPSSFPLLCLSSLSTLIYGQFKSLTWTQTESVGRCVSSQAASTLYSVP